MEAWGSGLGLGSESLARTAAGRTSFVEAARPKIRLCAPRGRGQNGERDQLPRCRAGSKHALHPKRPDGARHFDRRRDGGGVGRFLERDHRLAAEVAAREKKSVRFVSLLLPPMACSPSPRTPPRTAPQPSAEGSRASQCRSAPSAARRLGNAARPFPIARQSSCHDLKSGRVLADSSPPRERREGPPADCPPPRSHEQGYTDQTTELVFRAHPHGWRVGIFLSGTDALSFRFSFVSSTSIGWSPASSTPAATPTGFKPSS